MVDWTRPIEAVEKISGRVVPMEYAATSHLSADDEAMVMTKESPAGNSNNNWYMDGRDWCTNDAWYIRNVEEPQPVHTHTYDFSSMTITGLPVPDGFAEVMKHTITGDKITGIVIDAPYSLSVITPNGTFEFRITKIN